MVDLCSGKQTPTWFTKIILLKLKYLGIYQVRNANKIRIQTLYISRPFQSLTNPDCHCQMLTEYIYFNYITSHSIYILEKEKYELMEVTKGDQRVLS